MERERLKTLLQAKPFQPFTVHVDDGDLIGVRSPEFIWLPPIGKACFIVTKTDEDGEGEMKMLSLDHISQVTVSPLANAQFPTE